MIMIRAGVLAAADPQHRGGLGHGAGQRQDVPQDVPEEQELPQEEVQGTGFLISIYTVTATVDKAILKTACQRRSKVEKHAFPIFPPSFIIVSM